MIPWTIKVSSEESDRRLDNFLRFKLKVPRSHLYRLIRTGHIKVNGRRTVINYRLVTGDYIKGWKPILKVPAVFHGSSKFKESLLKRVIYEDQNFLVLNKPAGLATHGGSGINFGVIEILRNFYPKQSLSLVHRLDRETSGALIIAKKHSTLRVLNNLIMQGRIAKFYRLLVKGQLPHASLKVEVPLVKNQLKSGERLVAVDSTGKPSVTLFRSIAIGEHCSLIEAELKTGRTHQIRVHSAYAGFPILGDGKYGDKIFNHQASELGYHGLYLHAYRLKWQMPEGKIFDFILPPVDFSPF